MSGAPKKNKNALKHGLYAQHYAPDEQVRLDEAPPLEAIDEIKMLRSALDKILVLIEASPDQDTQIKLYNSLFTGTQRLLAAMRTHSLLVADSEELLTSFWEAVSLFRQEHNIE
jgi:hypothetical protein